MNKRLSETTDDEIILELVEQLKGDNERLKKELADKSRPTFDFTFVTRLLRDLVDNDIVAFFFWAFVVMAVIAGLYGLFNLSGPNGQFYVVRNGNSSYTPEHDCKIPAAISKPCFQIMSEVTLGHDDFVAGCFEDKNEAYETAEEFAAKWEKLNVR